MLSIDVIENKPLFLNPITGIEHTDLVTSSWNSRNIRYGLKTVAVVTEDTEMRPDLVSMLFQGDSSKLGSLLKINNISNPISLERGEILAVPSDLMVKDLFENNRSQNNQKEKSKSFRKELQEKISKVSEGRLEYLNSKNISNLSETPLPPNILLEGQKQISIENGKLIFGPDIGQCRNKLSKNVSVTDLKSRLAQKNIFKK